MEFKNLVLFLCLATVIVATYGSNDKNSGMNTMGYNGGYGSSYYGANQPMNNGDRDGS